MFIVADLVFSWYSVVISFFAVIILSVLGTLYQVRPASFVYSPFLLATICDPAILRL